MAIALFNDQDTLAGQRLGISTAKALLLMTMGLGLGAMNIYHMGNAITSKLLTPDSSFLLYALFYFIAACIAFIEVPVTEEIVTKESRGQQATGHRWTLIIVACMAMGGGVYSITTDAEKSDARRTAHSTSESSFEDLKQSLISERNVRRSSANNSVERSQANRDYFRQLAALKNQQAAHQSTRPPQPIETGSFWHWLWAAGFSFLCSVGVIVITAYLAKYHKPLTEIPRVFFKVKEEQEWTMNDDDVRVIPAHVDLTNGQSNQSGRAVLSTPPAHLEKGSLTSSGKRATENRPAPDESIAGAVLKGENAFSVRTLNEGDKVDYSDAHYQAIEQGILSGQIKPTHRPIRAKLIALNVKFVDDAARANKATSILKKLLANRVIIRNPEFGKSGKVVAKYILNPDNETSEKRAAKAVSIVQLDEPLECVCPHCEAFEEVRATDQHGSVKSICGKAYKAADNLVPEDA